MAACTYVGRVGGLAIALGVGSALLGGTAVGWADDAGAAANSSGSAQSSAADGPSRGGASSSTGTRRPAGTRSATVSPRQIERGSRLAAADANSANAFEQPAAPAAAAAAQADIELPDQTPAPVEVPASPVSTLPEPAAESAPDVADPVESVPAVAILPVAPEAAEPVSAPASAPVASVLTESPTALTDPSAGDNTGVPVDSPLDWTTLAFARRNPLSTAALPQLAVAAVPTLPLILGPSGVPIPSPAFGDVVMNYYITPNSPDGTLPQQLIFTPEGLYPITGVKSLPLNTSTDQGVQILHDTLANLPAGTSVTVFGYSQSAIISSLLQGGYTVKVDGKPVKFTVPSDLDVSFVLVGNEMNPDGGFLSRFSGRDMPMFSLTSLGIDFYGATPGGQIPADGGPIQTYYPTTNYTREYDGFADFPRYPLNFLADLNAALGIVYVHTKYAPVPSPPASKPCQTFCLTQTEVENAIALPSSQPTQHYYFMPTMNLPLLQPLRAVPFIGTPIADLLQPALKVAVNLGYGDQAHGFKSGPQPNANELTPFGVFPQVDPAEVVSQFAAGIKQGIQDFFNDFGPNGSVAQEVAGFSWPAPPSLAAAGSGDFIKTVQTVITSIADSVSGAAASLYAAFLPTADIINALVTTLPAYNVNLFLYGMKEVFSGQVINGLVDSIGLPLASDVGLVTTAGLVGALVWAEAVGGAFPGA